MKTFYKPGNGANTLDRWLRLYTTLVTNCLLCIGQARLVEEVRLLGRKWLNLNATYLQWVLYLLSECESRGIQDLWNIWWGWRAATAELENDRPNTGKTALKLVLKHRKDFYVDNYLMRLQRYELAYYVKQMQWYWLFFDPSVVQAHTKKNLNCWY